MGPAPVGLLAPLGWGEDERLVLDGPHPQQQLLVVLDRLESKSGRDREHLRTTQSQQAVQLGEPRVVAMASLGGFSRYTPFFWDRKTRKPKVFSPCLNYCLNNRSAPENSDPAR